MDVRIVNDEDVEFRGEAMDILRTFDSKQIKLMEAVVNAFLDYRASIALRMKEVIFHGPATIIYWEDGDKTVVKCMKGDHMNPEMGIAMATLKKMLGGSYKDFKKHTYEMILKDTDQKMKKKLNKCIKEIAKAVKKVEVANEPET